MRREDVLRDALCGRREGVRGDLLMLPFLLLWIVSFLWFNLCVARSVELTVARQG